MVTPNKIIRVSIENNNELANFFENSLSKCLEVLKAGKTIVFPTETLYGLGVDITNKSAIDHLIELKGRPENMPIAVAVTTLDQVRSIVEVSDFAKTFIERCIPNPITILLPVKPEVNLCLTSGSKLLGLRFPVNPITEALINRFGPLTATSANLHGSGHPITIDPAIAQFGEQVGMYIDTGACQFAGPSTVVDISLDTIKIIRDGVCSGEKLKKCLRGN